MLVFHLCLESPDIMIFVPLPFVSALLLLILLVQMMRRSQAAWCNNPFFMLLLAAYAAQSVVIGLHWGYGLGALAPLQPVLAALIAPLTWLSFRSLTAQGAVLRWRTVWPHFTPAVLILFFVALWSGPIDLTLIVVFLGYGLALLWLTREGPDVLVASQLDGVLRSYRSLQFTAISLIVSALSDIIISFDFAWTGGAHSGAVIAVFNMIALPVLGGAASLAGATAVHAEPEDKAPATAAALETTQADAEVAAALDGLMVSRQLYKDTELNLGRIARKLNVPARRVSTAVNRIHAMSLSHFVNNHRIREACRLLATTDEPVTNVMFESGFLSKSNFNREFLRVKGVSPAAWRRHYRQSGTAGAFIASAVCLPNAKGPVVDRAFATLHTQLGEDQ